VVDSEPEMAEAIKRPYSIDPRRCPESASERFDIAGVAAAYEEAYCDVIANAELVRA
jgi:hypothetical protein